MKEIRLIIVLFVLIFGASNFGFSQSNKNIAKIDSAAFWDEKTGIKILTEANNKFTEDFKKDFDKELKDLSGLQEKILKGQKLIEQCGFLCCDESIYKSKLAEIASFADEYKKNEESLTLIFKERKAKALGKIIKEISEALETYTNDKDYLIVFDSRDVVDIMQGEVDDITREFINFYNNLTLKKKDD